MRGGWGRRVEGGFISTDGVVEKGELYSTRRSLVITTTFKMHSGSFHFW